MDEATLKARIEQLELAIRCAKNELDCEDSDFDSVIGILIDALPSHLWSEDETRAACRDSESWICENNCSHADIVRYEVDGELITFGFPADYDPVERGWLREPWPRGGTVDYCPVCVFEGRRKEAPG